MLPEVSSGKNRVWCPNAAELCDQGHMVDALGGLRGGQHLSEPWELEWGGRVSLWVHPMLSPS